jgi:release factor glutamine methyltransferase
MTIREFKAESKKELSKITENPDFEAEQIIKHVLKISKNSYLLNKNMQIEDKKLEKLYETLKMRMDRIPLQYICKEWEFYGLRIFCGKGCLVPRQETELIAQETIKRLKPRGHFIDLCTGSGCISVAVLNNVKQSSAQSVDISAKALKYAEKNCKYHNLEDRMDIIRCDIKKFVPKRKADIIVANPPYIKSKDMPHLPPEVKYEPEIALDGGEDGLDFYRIIAARYARYLKKNGIIICETGYDTAKEVKQIFEENGFEAEIFKDVFGEYRMCVAKINQEKKL